MEAVNNIQYGPVVWSMPNTSRYNEPRLQRAMESLGQLELTESDFRHLAVLCADQGMMPKNVTMGIAAMLDCEPFEER